MNRRPWEQQLQDAFDGALSEADGMTLAARLRESPAALAEYCDQAILEAELRRHAAGHRRIPGAIPAAARLDGRTRRSRFAVISLASAAAVVLLGALVLRMMLEAEAQVTRVALAPGSILVAPDGSAMSGDALANGETWTLGQGVAEIHFPNRVRAVIDGPASIRIVADDRMEISGGHAWFHVPSSAAGFRVTAPEFEVVDLGTEFGIDMREDLPAEVHCLQGRVEIRARGANREIRTLEAGQAARLEPAGRWNMRAADDEKFRTDLPRQLPSFTLGLTEISGDRIPVRGDITDAAGATARLIHPERARIVHDAGGPALELDGAHVETDWPGISGTAPRTFAAWCRFPAGYRPATAPPLALWGNPTTGWNRKFKIAVAGDDSRTTLRVSFGEHFTDGSTDLSDGRWHHLAVVYEGNAPDGTPRVRMFVDGNEEQTRVTGSSIGGIRTETETTRSVALSLGRYELPARKRDPFLRATLRDYRIVAGALGPEEIRALAGDAE